MPQKAFLEITASHPDGRKVVSGVYAFYETHGIPLDVLLSLLIERWNAVPDWVDLLQSMIRAGRKKDRAFETVEAAMRDAYGSPTSDEFVRLLDLLHLNWHRYA